MVLLQKLLTVGWDSSKSRDKLSLGQGKNYLTQFAVVVKKAYEERQCFLDLLQEKRKEKLY